MKKILSLLLVMVMVLSLAACGGVGDGTNNDNNTVDPTTEPTTAPTTEPTTAPTTEPTTEPSTEPSTEAGNALASFSMSISENFAPVRNLYISDNGDGTVFVEYLGEVRKMSFAFDGAALKVIADALATLDLESLGEGGWEEETTVSCSLYVSYADYSMVMYDYAGTEIPELFNTMMNTMDAAFQTALAELEVYVPQMQIMEGIDATIETELLTIMNNSGIVNLDSLGAMSIPTDDAESFGYAAGLSSNEGITAAAVCQNMMMGGAAFQLVIVSLADESKAADVAADFEAKADFGKWVCVRPDQALIAQKGNLVLCLMAPNDMFAGTSASIADAGWTTLKTLTDPLAG